MVRMEATNQHNVPGHTYGVATVEHGKRDRDDNYSDAGGAASQRRCARPHIHCFSFAYAHPTMLTTPPPERSETTNAATPFIHRQMSGGCTHRRSS